MLFEEELLRIYKGERRDKAAVLPSFRDRDRIAEHVAAMLNATGGYIFFEAPVDNPDEVEKEIREIGCMVDPPVSLLTVYFVEEGKKRVAILVPESAEKPHLVAGKVLVWKGGEPVPMSREEVVKLIRQSEDYRSFDAIVRSDLPGEILDPAMIKIFADKTGSAPLWMEDVLEEHGLTISGKPTNAAIILFSNEPEAYVFGTGVEVIVYKDLESQEIEAAYPIRGSLLKKLEIIEDTISTYLRKILGDEEIACFKKALFEIVLNAVSHRDYRYPAPIIIRLSPEAFEIWNPGGLPGGLSIEDLQNLHTPYHRNPLLSRSLRKMGFVQFPGAGTNYVLKMAELCGLPRPVFTEAHGGFLCSIPLMGVRLEEELNERQKLLLEYLKVHREITRREYQEMVKVSERTARMDLEELIKKGYLRRIGRGKFTKYVLL